VLAFTLHISTKELALMALVFGVLQQAINLGRLLNGVARKRIREAERKLLHKPVPPRPVGRTISIEEIESIQLRPPVEE
jgi:hypothetical protein